MKFPGGMNIQQMMKQAQKAQEQMTKEMDEMRVDASAGGGIISVQMTGSKELIAIKIDPEFNFFGIPWDTSGIIIFSTFISF